MESVRRLTEIRTSQQPAASNQRAAPALVKHRTAQTHSLCVLPSSAAGARQRQNIRDGVGDADGTDEEVRTYYLQ